jgi:hypothetical protein
VPYSSELIAIYPASDLYQSVGSDLQLRMYVFVVVPVTNVYISFGGNCDIAVFNNDFNGPNYVLAINGRPSVRHGWTVT